MKVVNYFKVIKTLIFKTINKIKLSFKGLKQDLIKM